METTIGLNDIADDLLILNKHTIDTLFTLDNCADCIALYVFYYKTAKWQKTDTIKATDEYIKKSLKWGYDKIRKTKSTLKESGLIDIVQRRKDGKIDGWYVKVSYIVSQRKTEDIYINVQDSKNTQNLQVENPRSTEQEANALKYNNKCLNNKNKMLKENMIVDSYGFNEEVKEALYAFIDMRKAIKKPMTERALKMLINKLNKMTNDDNEKIAILDQSIMHNWQDIYELKENKQYKNTYRNNIVVDMPAYMKEQPKENKASNDIKERIRAMQDAMEF